MSAEHPLPPSFERMYAAVRAREDRDALQLARDGFLMMPLGDDGECGIAFGWVNRKRFARQCREFTGDEDVTYHEIRHSWAIEDGVGEDAVYHEVAEGTPNAFKATWW